MNPDEVSFHEATVLDFTSEGDTVRLVLDRATIVVSGVKTMTADDEPIDTLEMELEDGEVLTLEIGERHILLIVEWNDFARRISCTRAYEIHGETVLVSPPA